MGEVGYRLVRSSAIGWGSLLACKLAMNAGWYIVADILLVVSFVVGVRMIWYLLQCMYVYFPGNWPWER